MSDGLVSVIIPTYYRNDRLRDVIQSVEAQTYEPIEIIVVDDSGEAHARPVAEDFDVTYLAHDENRGGNPARNTGIEAANGEYIQLLDDDDELHHEKIAKQVTLLKQSPDVGVVYCGVYYEKRDTERLPAQEGRGDVLDMALRFHFPCGVPSAMLIRSELMHDIPPLRAREAADDVGMKIELAVRTAFDYIPEVLVTMGDTGHHRSDTVGFSRELENIINEYRHLYRQRPAQIERQARSHMYAVRAFRLRDTHVWSAGAIIAYAKSMYYSESIEFEQIAGLVATVLGKPGWRVASWLNRRLSRDS